jgi:hypothetical protein
MADFADAEFNVPLYNVWTKAKKTNGTDHFGNSEQTWVENLIYAYTEPFDIVIDPFAGGGSTFDVCMKRFRRVWTSDRKPIESRSNVIRKHDLVQQDGSVCIPNIPKGAKLVYLDPPYWAQARGQYSNDPTDLANMSLEQFTDTMAAIIDGFKKKMATSGGYIALIIQPTQWNSEGRSFTDHIADMIKAVKLPLDMRIQAPYQSQQCTPQQVEWAKANRKFLVISREIVVWRVDGKKGDANDKA